MTEENNNRTDEKNSAAGPQGGADTKFLVIVGGLLTMIIICLSMLWLVERKKRVAAEQSYAELAQYQQKLQSAMSRIPAVLPQLDQSARAVNREDLSPVQANLDGRATSLFKISSSAGRRMGFAPGDLILVGPEQAQTATAPAK